MYKYIRNNIRGKRIGGNLYFHKSIIPELPEELREEIRELKQRLNRHYPHNECNIIKIDEFSGVISFIASRDFDTFDEPHIDASYRMTEKGIPPKLIDYRLRDPDKVPVYHHKWMFVADDYKGFDVKKSKERSAWWEMHPLVLSHISRNKYFKSRIGLHGLWNNVLKEMEEYDRSQ